MSGKAKKVEILKKWSSKSGQNILTKPHILSWNFFFKSLQKIFCKFYEHIQGIWEVRLTYFFASVKNRDRTTCQSDYIATKRSWGENHDFLSVFKISSHFHDLTTWSDHIIFDWWSLTSITSRKFSRQVMNMFCVFEMMSGIGALHS